VKFRKLGSLGSLLTDFAIDGHTGQGTFHYPVPATSVDRWGLELLTIEVFCPLLHRTVWCVLTSDLRTVHLFTVHHSRPLTQLTVAPLAHWTCTVHIGQSDE
jgi:hypothetical protein